MRRFSACLLSLGLALGACDLPVDPAGSTERISGGTLRVGEITGNDAALQADRAIVAVLADGLDAEIEIHEGETHDLIHRLEAGEIDIVVGGLPAATPHGDRIGMSREAGPLFWSDAEKRRVLAVRAGENALLLRVNDAIAREEGG